jgi:hypothetical protein
VLESLVPEFGREKSHAARALIEQEFSFDQRMRKVAGIYDSLWVTKKA